MPVEVSTEQIRDGEPPPAWPLYPFRFESLESMWGDRVRVRQRRGDEPGQTIHSHVQGGRAQGHYVPSEKEVTLLLELYPGFEPRIGAPWSEIQADLIRTGEDPAGLRDLMTPAIIALLKRNAEDSSGARENGGLTNMPGELNPLAEVMAAFRDGHALYSDGGFEVFTVTSELAQAYFASPACGSLGSIFFRNSSGKETLSCLLVFGNYRGMEWAESTDAFDLFAGLAKRAGAQLPLDAQKQLSAKQNDAAGTWLAFMTLYSPPGDDQYHCRRSWGEPFLSAANAIERYLLDKSQTPLASVPPAANHPSRRDRSQQSATWQDAKNKAERHVKRSRYPGVKALAKIVGCAPSTMSKAIERSSYLRARKAEHAAERRGKPRETSLTGLVLDNQAQSTEPDPRSVAESHLVTSEESEMDRLIAEQKADDKDPDPTAPSPPRKHQRSQ